MSCPIMYLESDSLESSSDYPSQDISGWFVAALGATVVSCAAFHTILVTF